MFKSCQSGTNKQDYRLDVARGRSCLNDKLDVARGSV